MVQGDPERPAISLCSVGDFIPGLFERPLFEGMTVLKGGDYFYGVGWVHLGNATRVRENAPRVVENLAATGAEQIVFYHDDCYALMAAMVDEYGVELPFRAVHIIEYLLDHVQEHSSQVKPLGIRVACQQPCASRYTPWKDEQSEELFRLIGVERVERQYDRLGALCCGSAVMPRDRDKAAAIKERNITDAVDNAAQAMAYLCPLCVLNMRKLAGAAGLENLHLIELVNRALYE